jgi:methionine-R-sulfoxide reductase
MRYVAQILGVSLGLMASCNAQDAQNESNSMEEKTYPVRLTPAQWQDSLSDEQYYILREKGTERPGTGELYLHTAEGTYSCAGCGSELFTSDMKFQSHCGWPSFDREIKGDKVERKLDKSHGMMRTEILCANCGGHLGHVFNDGPTATGERYCVNSLSLQFSPVEKEGQTSP